MPRRHTAVFGALIVSTALLAACSQGRGVDQDDPAVGVRALLEGTAAPVLTVGSDTVHVSERTVAFYGGRSFAPAWTDDDGFTDRGATMAGLLRDRSDGLDAEKYHAATL